MKKKYNAFLLLRGDYESLKKDKFDIISNIIPLTPNTLSEIDCLEKRPLISPLKIYNAAKIRKNVKRIKEFQDILTYELSKNKYLSIAGNETFINSFNTIIGHYYYLHEILVDNGPWLIYDGKIWTKNTSLEVALEVIFKRLINENLGLFGEPKPIKQNFRILVKIINYFIVRFISNFNIIVTTGTSYNLEYIIKLILSKNKNNVVIYFSPVDKKSVLRSLKTIFDFLFRKDFLKNPVRVSLLFSPVTDHSKLIDNILKKTFKFESQYLATVTKKFLKHRIDYTETTLPCIKNIFKKLKPKILVAHHLRWNEMSSLGQVANECNVPVFLISHGSHTKGIDKYSDICLSNLNRGLIESPFLSKTVAQSPLAYNAIKNKEEKEKIICAKPIMWGVNTLHENKNIIDRKNFIILHAGTYKRFGSRPLIYENSNDYYYSIKLLIDVIKRIKNVKLIIRVREEPIECDFEALKKLLPNFKNKNWEFSDEPSMEKDIKRSNLLISYSSTTIEEALHAKVPVGLFSANLNYRHINKKNNNFSINKRNPVYHLNKENLFNELNEIVKLHKNRCLDEKEINSYVWGNDKMNNNQLINKILDIN